jgi:hypothetical protein
MLTFAVGTVIEIGFKNYVMDQSNKAMFVEMEKAVMKAFKEKDEKAFIRDFAKDYIGVSGDGIKNTAAEVAGMYRLDLDRLSSTNETVSFPAETVAILSYIMSTDGQAGGKNFSATIYCSTVFLKQADRWKVVLHTESMAAR